MTPEQYIIEGLYTGDDNAYKYLYEAYYKTLCIYACQYVEDSFVAETIVNDVIFQIWLKKEEIEIRHSLRNYLMQSVKNNCLNYLEQQKRQLKLKLHYSEKISNKELDFENQSDYPLATLLEKELDTKIKKALNSLPEQTRIFFEMSRVYNMKYSEIAEKTGKSVDTVKYHIKSALAILREELKDHLLFLLILLFANF